MSTKSSQTGYVRIWNNAPTGGVPREALLLLGLSTKRGDEATIGRFGSGIKFAPISALRKGYEFIVACFDINGSYNFHMEEVKDSKYGEIEFVFNDGTRRASSYTTGAGEVSWDSDFQIIREAIANARDAVTENPGFSWGWEYADALDPNPTLFEVWITASEGVRKVMDSFEEFFAFERDIVSTYAFRSLYDKGIPSPLRAYAHGILVHENTMNSLFDVEYRDFELTEERTIKYEFQLADAIKLLMKYGNEGVVSRVLTHVLHNKTSKVYELSEAVANRFFSFDTAEEDSLWPRIVNRVFPNKTVFLDSTDSKHAPSLRSRGYNPFIVDEHTRKVLKMLGCPTADDAIREINDRERIIDWNWSNYPILEEAIYRTCAVIPGLDDLLINIGVWDTNDSILGVATNINGKRTILITKNHAEHYGLTDIIGTIVHECDHIMTNIGDGDEVGRQFRNIADNHIGELINRIYNHTHNKED